MTTCGQSAKHKRAMHCLLMDGGGVRAWTVHPSLWSGSRSKAYHFEQRLHGSYRSSPWPPGDSLAKTDCNCAKSRGHTKTTDDKIRNR